MSRQSGFSHTEETKQKLSDMRKGEKNPFYGRQHSQETKAKLASMLREVNAKRQYNPMPQTIKIPSEEAKLAYIAGIVDGEGSIKYRNGRPFVAIYNTNRDLMSWLNTTLGAKSPMKSCDNRGRLPVYRWSVEGAMDVYALCVAIKPYLIVKYSEAVEAIEHLENKYGRENWYLVD